MEPFTFHSSENIITQNEDGAILYLLGAGEAECYRKPVVIFLN